MLKSQLGRLTRLATSIALAAGLTTTGGVLTSSEANADEFPTRPIQLIVPYRAGGGTDTMARVFARAMSDELGEAVVVVNHAGGGGAIGGSVSRQCRT